MKKRKRSTPVSRVAAGEQAKQFSDDLYAVQEVLFCRFCSHSLDYTRVDTLKDHLKSKKHLSKKEAHQKQGATGASTSKQTLGTLMKSKHMRENFILDLLEDVHCCRYPSGDIEGRFS